MRKRDLLLILPVFALVLAALACGESTPEVPVVQTQVVEVEVVVTATPETGETPATPARQPVDTPPGGSARSNPVPLGSEITLDNLTFSVSEFVRPAGRDRGGYEPEGGGVIVLVTLSVRCEKGEDESCSIGWPELSLVGSADVVRDVIVYQDYFSGDELFGGVTVTYSGLFKIGPHETDMILIHGEPPGEAFFALQ